MTPVPDRIEIWRVFQDLGVQDLYALLALRNAVFIVEQRCAYQDIDGLDPSCLHLLVKRIGQEPLLGCLRVIPPGVQGASAQIGRVATAPEARGIGLGRWMMNGAITEIRRRFGRLDIDLGAQTDAEGFYARLGFRRISEDYLEDGIAHCTMRLPI